MVGAALLSPEASPLGAAGAESAPATPPVGIAVGSCEVEPVEIAAFDPGNAATPVPRDDLDVIGAYRSSSELPVVADLDAVNGTLELLVQCANEGDFAKVASLFSQDFWLEEVGGNPFRASYFARQVAASPSPPAEQIDPQFSFDDARLMADGRIAGVWRWAGSGPNDAELLVLVRWEQRWLIDQVVFVDDPGVLATPIA
jgi:hypothetical protein